MPAWVSSLMTEWNFPLLGAGSNVLIRGLAVKCSTVTRYRYTASSGCDVIASHCCLQQMSNTRQPSSSWWAVEQMTTYRLLWTLLILQTPPLAPRVLVCQGWQSSIAFRFHGNTTRSNKNFICCQTPSAKTYLWLRLWWSNFRGRNWDI